MNLSQLQTFCTVCECFSFTDAAAKLCISQPAVSRQIAAMETEIGTALFERTHSTITLMPAGDYLRQQLPDLLESLQETLRETKRIGDGETGRLNVGLLEDQSLDPIVSKVLQSLQRDHISLRIQRFDFRSLESALLGDRIDLAISIRQGAYSFPECEYYAYTEEAMCYSVKAGVIPESKQTITMEDIHRYDRAYPLLIPSLDSFQAAQLSELKDLSSWTEYPGQQYDFSSISPMVAAGLAATVANETHILSLDRNVRLIPIPTLPAVQKCLFWLPRNRNPVIARMLERLGT